ncbi:MAG TPA: 4-hydroxy-tetrahydrodipicolinate reductase [Spirochaetia bacterium]|nr:4-hydroxy-tetrahydrodipicolinate reductase [Spirochaetia bacterium]
MRIAIVGYGSMGREVEKVLLERGHQVAARVDPAQPGADGTHLTEEMARRSDMAIEFSHAEAVLENARAYARFGLSAVTGTTGWYAKLDELRAIVGASKIGYLYGSNFSIGAHLFFALVAAATELANTCPEYDIMGWEVHHKRKKDSPSGTALTIARIITGQSERKKKVVTERLDRAPAEDELHFASVRGGEVPGTHTVLLDSLFDTIELTHRARSRGGLALGGVRAAEWLVGKHGVFEVNDFIQSLLQRRHS